MRDTPWLGKVALCVIGFLFVAGSAFMAFVSYRQYPYMASPAQFAAIAAIIAFLTVAAFLLPKRGEPTGANAPIR